jgi:hypothetical protein
MVSKQGGDEMKIRYYDNRLMAWKEEKGLTYAEFNSRIGDLRMMAAGGWVSEITWEEEE